MSVPSSGPALAGLRPPESAGESGFTPRAFTMAYSPAAGWHKPQLLPIEQLALHPGAAGLHNGQIVIEGLKAYRRIDSTIAAFRPWEHARRLRDSARRAAMPALPADLFVSAVEELVEADAGSLDDAPGSSLYLRSLMFAADLSLGRGPARRHGFVLMAQSDHPGARSASDQLDGANLFAVRATRPRAEVTLLEPEDEVLRGVMAESVLTLASRLGYIVRQQRVTREQWRRDPGHGASEVFRCGAEEGIAAIGDDAPGPVTAAITHALSDIQSGREPGPRGWMYQLPSAELS